MGNRACIPVLFRSVERERAWILGELGEFVQEAEDMLEVDGAVVEVERYR